MKKIKKTVTKKTQKKTKQKKNSETPKKKITVRKTVKKILVKKKKVVSRKIADKPERKKPSLLALKKVEDNPIISPSEENGWESWQTFNPAAVLLGEHVHFLYRAIGNDGLSRFGHAVSKDGLKVDNRLSFPAYEHALVNSNASMFYSASGGSWGGCEDPRMVKIEGEDKIYVTYTACDQGLRVGITSIKVKDFLEKKWKWKKPKLISAPGEVHKNWVIFPEKINGKYAVIHSINPVVAIAYLDNLDFKNGEYVESHFAGMKRKNCWDNWVRGAGPPPIKTKYGWLVLYHAMDQTDFGKYKVGAMLLDLNDPTKILHRAKEPILEPSEVYEYQGFKGGVVYASGSVIKNGKIFVYYGGADSYVCVAYTDLDLFLEELVKDEAPKLKKVTLGKKVK